MELMGDLYDYPRENIERRKLIRQLRRTGLQSGFTLPDAVDAQGANRQADIYGALLDMESESVRFEEASRKTGA